MHAFQGVNLESTLNPSEFVGRAPEQVDEFLAEVSAANFGEVWGAKVQAADVNV